jgi:uncharacterized protein (DUF2062 family)
MTWQRVGFFRQFKLNLIKLIRLRAEPDQIARGMALGLFVGMTPTFGVQLIIVFVLAVILKQNKIAALIGVWNTNAFTAPLIYGLEYEVGRVLLGLPRLDVQLQFNYEMLQELGWQFFAPLCLGSIVLGIPVALIGYAVTLHFVPVMRQWKIPRWPRPNLRRGRSK